MIIQGKYCSYPKVMSCVFRMILLGDNRYGDIVISTGLHVPCIITRKFMHRNSKSRLR